MSQITRRRFLDFSMFGSLGALAAAVIYPICRFFMPTEAPQAAQSEVIAAKIGELNPNSSKIFKFGNEPGLLILTEDGKYLAFSAVCTHLDCIVQYHADNKQIWCACHNGYFDLFGKNLSGPPPSPLEEYKVDLIDENVIVSKKA